jgi:hypothetical protein
VSNGGLPPGYFALVDGVSIYLNTQKSRTPDASRLTHWRPDITDDRPCWKRAILDRDLANFLAAAVLQRDNREVRDVEVEPTQEVRRCRT